MNTWSSSWKNRVTSLTRLKSRSFSPFYKCYFCDFLWPFSKCRCGGTRFWRTLIARSCKVWKRNFILRERFWFCSCRSTLYPPTKWTPWRPSFGSSLTERWYNWKVHFYSQSRRWDLIMEGWRENGSISSLKWAKIWFSLYVIVDKFFRFLKNPNRRCSTLTTASSSTVQPTITPSRSTPTQGFATRCPIKYILWQHLLMFSHPGPPSLL